MFQFVGGNTWQSFVLFPLAVPRGREVHSKEEQGSKPSREGSLFMVALPLAADWPICSVVPPLTADWPRESVVSPCLPPRGFPVFWGCISDHTTLLSSLGILLPTFIFPGGDPVLAACRV